MQELIKRLEKDKWHVSGVDIQEAINLIESQAAEIGKYKSLCNQMGNALQMMRGFYPAYCDEALEAWRALK